MNTNFLRVLLFIWATAALAGCTGAKPYAKIAVGYQLDAQSDWYVRTDRTWQCSTNVPFEGEVGFEDENGWSVYYEHNSWVFCGGPFWKDEPELYRDSIWIAKKFGGVK